MNTNIKNNKSLPHPTTDAKKFEIPDFELNQFARFVVDACKEFYADPENVKRFEQWKAERESKHCNTTHTE